jgi:hypothetical protein
MYSICHSAQFFHQKNGPQKCCDFADLLQRNQKFTSKSPAHAAKNAENSAFLAHLEPEILLIEVCLLFGGN